MLVTNSLSRSVLLAAGLSAGLPACGHDAGSSAVLNAFEGSTGPRVLVISATNDRSVDTGIELAAQALERQGLAYDHYVATQGGEIRATQQLKLQDASGAPRYSAVILTNDRVVFENRQGQWVSGLTEGQWSELQQYEARNKVKRVALYSYPSAEIGVAPYQQATGAATDLLLGEEAQKVLPGVQGVRKLRLENSWRYPAQVVNQELTRPVLYFQDMDIAPEKKAVAAALVQAGDGRQQMHFFFSQGRAIEASNQLAPLWMEWLVPSQYTGAWKSTFEGFDSFTGKIKVDPFGGRYQLSGNLGNLQVSGPAVLAEGKLLAAWAKKGKEVLLAVGQESGTAGMTGQFMMGQGLGEQGTFQIEGLSLRPRQGSHAFTIQSESIGTLQGTVEVKPMQQTIEMIFNIQGQTLQGVALRSGKQLIMAVSPESNYGLVEYTTKQAAASGSAGEESGRVQGRWVRQGHDVIFAQTLERQQD